MDHFSFRKYIVSSYPKSVDKKLTKSGELMKTLKDNIINLFYIEHLKAKDIADKVNTSSAYITNEAYRKWNCSTYKYNPSKKKYEFDNKLGRSIDVPKYIKER